MEGNARTAACEQLGVCSTLLLEAATLPHARHPQPACRLAATSLLLATNSDPPSAAARGVGWPPPAQSTCGWRCCGKPGSKALHGQGGVKGHVSTQGDVRVQREWCRCGGPGSTALQRGEKGRQRGMPCHRMQCLACKCGGPGATALHGRGQVNNCSTCASSAATQRPHAWKVPPPSHSCSHSTAACKTATQQRYPT